MELNPRNIFSGITAIGTITTMALSFNAGDSIDSIGKARQNNLDRITNSQELERSERDRLRQQEIANARYQACELVVMDAKSGVDGLIHPSLNPAISVIDRNTGKPFPRGTVVCDSNGNTGILDSEGKPSAIAFTGDRDIIKNRVKRFRGGIYSQPLAK